MKKIQEFITERIINDRARQHSETINSDFVEVTNMKIGGQENGYLTVFVTAIFDVGHNEFIEKTFDLFDEKEIAEYYKYSNNEYL